MPQGKHTESTKESNCAKQIPKTNSHGTGGNKAVSGYLKTSEWQSKLSMAYRVRIMAILC